MDMNYLIELTSSRLRKLGEAYSDWWALPYEVAVSAQDKFWEFLKGCR